MGTFNADLLATFNRLTAKKIEEKMRPLRMSPTENAKRRWIWELLQNAKDKASIDFPNQQVSISINFQKDYLEFCHNFGYFTTKNIEGLIRQISSDDKDRDEVEPTETPRTTGRFGTGFMTTHLLSEKVQVQGLYKNSDGSFQKIQFPLDRSGRDLKSIIQSITHSFEAAEESVKSSPLISTPIFSQFNTVFRYELDEKGDKVAKIGLEDLTISLPYTLIFIDRIKSVEVHQDHENVIYRKKEPKPLNENIKVIEFDKIQNGVPSKLYYAILSQGATSIAIQLDLALNKKGFSIQPFNSKIPRLFLDFPLIGTEEFNFPVIVNNPYLEPTEPRDGVFLSDEIDQTVSENKTILQIAVNLYFNLLDYAVQNDWENIYFLARTNLPSQKEWLSINWYREQIQRTVRRQLLQTEIVYTNHPQFPKIPLENALFPYHPQKQKIHQIWQFAQALWDNRLPRQEDLEAWYDIIDSSWEKDLRYDLKKLAQDISALKNITNLSQRIQRSEVETLEWLNQLLKFIEKEDVKILSNFSLIPNQYDEFKKSEDLYTEQQISEQLKDILKLLEEDWYNHLKHRNITACNLPKFKENKDIIIRINSILKEKRKPQIKSAVLSLISCFPNEPTLPKKRQQLWQFAKEFYPETPEKHHLEFWHNDFSIWEEADQWFTDQILADISNLKNIKGLDDRLKLKSEALTWLNQLVQFINSLELTYLFKKYAILPNQKGEFKKAKDLVVDQEIDEQLKDILEELGNDYREALLSKEIVLDLDGKPSTSQDIAREIKTQVEAIISREGISNRSEKNKIIFSELLLWFLNHEKLAKEIFGDLYENRHRLRSDEEIKADIEFRQALQNNVNGYSEEEIIKLVNSPDGKLFVIPDDLTQEELEELIHKKDQDNEFSAILADLSKEDLEQLIQQLKGEKDQNATPVEVEVVPEFENPQKFLISLGINSPQEFEIAKLRFASTKYHRYFYQMPHYSSWEYLQEIIERAKQNVKGYLSQITRYNCDNWYEVSLTVIGGVTKDNQPIQLVIRPSDGGRIILYYESEFEALALPGTELWVDDSLIQENATLGKVLRKTGVTWIPW